MLHLFKFKPHTESRWLTLGTASRALTGSLSVGLVGLLQLYTEEAGTVLDHIPTIIETLSRPKVLQFLVVSSLGCYPCEAPLQALMPDARLCPRMSQLAGLFDEEVSWLQGLSRGVWLRFASMLAETVQAWELRDEILKYVLVSSGYLYQKLWQPLAQYPWKLAVGDPKENLDTLFSNPMPDDPFAAKLWRLHNLGSPAQPQLENSPLPFEKSLHPVFSCTPFWLEMLLGVSGFGFQIPPSKFPNTEKSHQI